jgi:hypothetical protein
MALTVSNKGKIVLTIKDSIRILPGALGKLSRYQYLELLKGNSMDQYHTDCLIVNPSVASLFQNIEITFLQKCGGGV